MIIPFRDKEKAKLSQQAAAAIEEFLNSGRAITVVPDGETQPARSMAEIHDDTYRKRNELDCKKALQSKRPFSKGSKA